MKLFRWSVPVLFAALVFPACQNDPKTPATTSPSQQPQPIAQQVAYICPMDCEKGKTYNQPGTCPVCKMDLEVATSEHLRHAATEVAAAVEITNLPADDPNKTLEEEVNALHDQVMKESSEMERVGRQLKEDFKTLSGEAERKPYTTAIAEISRAGFDMMAWMRDYRSPGTMSPVEASSYLKKQKASMLRIRAAVQQALANGKKLGKPVN